MSDAREAESQQKHEVVVQKKKAVAPDPNHLKYFQGSDDDRDNSWEERETLEKISSLSFCREELDDSEWPPLQRRARGKGNGQRTGDKGKGKQSSYNGKNKLRGDER